MSGWLAVSPLLVFIVVYLVSSIIAGDFYKVPVTAAFLVSSVYALLITPSPETAASGWRSRFDMDGRISIFSKGAGDPNVLMMIWIFVLAGAFAATAKEIGAIDATVQNEPEAQLYMLYVPGLYESPWRFKDATYRAVGLGWLTGIPFQKGVLDSFDDFLNSKLRYLCSVEQPPQHILESIQRNYDANARMVVEYENEKYAVFKFVSDEQ